MDDEDLQESARRMLQRIGWHESNLKQIEVYARMSPKDKIAQMFRLRSEYIRLLKARLRREHTDYSEAQLRQLFLDHLDMVRERGKVGF